MSWVGTLALAGLAGLNPWIVVVIVVGLATFTRQTALNEPYAHSANLVGLAVFAALLGIDVVVSKMQRAARFVEPVNVAAAAAIGALLPLALLPPGREDVVWAVLPGLGVALAMRWARYGAARRLDRVLKPFGHVAASMAADLVAGTVTAAVFALKP